MFEYTSIFQLSNNLRNLKSRHIYMYSTIVGVTNLFGHKNDFMVLRINHFLLF